MNAVTDDSNKLQSQENKINVDKMKTVPVDQRNVVNRNVVEKTVYEQLVTKIKSIKDRISRTAGFW